MTIDLVPLSQFSERYARGWRIVPGYPLTHGDYAATMQSPDHQKAVRNINRAAMSRQDDVRRVALKNKVEPA